jgi:eukaryotic-like serine/threonine-protein kinase
MSDRTLTLPGRNHRLDSVVAGYLDALASGPVPDRGEWLARHPDLADDLRAFFADHDRLVQLSAPLRDGAGAPPDTVRYFGDYALLEEIARGGMGVVYKARQVSLNRPVALKMILAGPSASPEDLRRFRAEAEAAAQLDHPNIVPIYEVGEHDGHPYFTMKLIDGRPGPLAGRIKGPRPAARLVATVARAVHHAHQRGILHRDLKPANILLDSRDEPQVTDFGLAKHLTAEPAASSPTRTGAIVGTPSYMAPEQARAVKGLTTAVDVYSLGAILYELLTGRPPFRASTALDTVLQVLDHEPPRPRALDPRLDRDLETVCLKCLEKDPQSRYGSAEALADDLDRWLAGVPVHARRSSAWERTVKWARRRPTVAALLAVTVLAALSAVVLGALVGARLKWERDRADEKRDEALRAREETQEQRNHAVRARGEADRQLDRARLSIYALQLAKVAAVCDRDPGLGLQLLQDPECCPPDLQDFAWGLLYRRCHLYRFSLGGPTTCAVDLAPHPGGAALGTLDRDTGAVRLWDLSSGRERAAPGIRVPRAKDLLCSPDGRTLALVREDQTVALWDMTTRTERCSLPKCVEQNRHIVVFAPDGKTLFTYASGSGVKRWDANTGREMAAFKAPWCWALACSPDGRTLALGEANDVRICDATTGQERAVLHSRSGQGISVLVYAPDGKTLAAVTGQFGLHGSVVVWNLEGGRLRFTLTPHEGEHFTSAAFSPDGKSLVAGVALGAGDDPGGAVRFWDATTGQERGSSFGHKYAVVGVRFAPDGKTLVSASAKQGQFRELFAWDVLPEQEWTTVHKAAEWASTAALAPDGRTLALGGRKGTLTLLDPATGQERAILRGHTKSIASLAFTPDGKTLASGADDQTVRLWAVADGRERARLTHEGSDTRLAFSPDGRTLAVASRNKPAVRFWDPVTGKDRSITLANEIGVCCLTYAPDGRTLAVSGVSTGLKLWDVEGDRDRASFPTRRGTAFGSVGIHSLAFSPNGKRLAAGDEEGIVTVVDVDKATDVVSWKAHLGTVTTPIDQGPDVIGFGSRTTHPGPGVLGLAFSPDGKTLATGGADPRRAWVVKLWDPVTGQGRATLTGRAPRAAPYVAFAPGGTKLFAVSGWHPDYVNTGDPERSEVLRWEVAAAPERVLVHDRSGTGPLALSPDGRTLVVGCGGDMARVYDTATGRRRATLPDGGYQSVQHVALTPDGSTVVTAGQDKTVTLWDPAGRERTRLEQQKPISALSLAPDGKTLAVGTWEGVAVWDVGTGREQKRMSLPAQMIVALCFAPDGRTLAIGALDGTLWLGDPSTGEVREVTTGHRNAYVRNCRVYAIAFAPDGETLATASGDQTVALWDVATGRKRATLAGHAHWVLTAAFSPDGKRLASGGVDGTVKLWDTDAGQLLRTWTEGSDVLAVTFTPDGERLVWSNGQRGQVKIRDIPLLDKK